jgi:hypothetical protein
MACFYNVETLIAEVCFLQVIIDAYKAIIRSWSRQGKIYFV